MRRPQIEHQKRGLDRIRFYHNALDDAGKIKAEIPLTGMDGIPLKHEIGPDYCIGKFG